MCKKGYKVSPGWQYVCIKDNGSVVYKGTGNCARFCSPDNVMFESITEVRKHHRKLLKIKKARLEEKKREKEIRMKIILMKNKQNKTDWKPNLPQVLESQMKESWKKKSGKALHAAKPRISKEKKPGKASQTAKKSISKWKITTKQLQHFFGLKEYPVIINQLNQKLWEDKQKFRQFYLPLVYLFNPGVHLLLIEAYLEAKWREVMAWDQ